jgi:phosphatidylglycerol:prolipoprotein diacylglycerol transferase
MYPFIHLGPLTIGTFGLMLWVSAVFACWVLYLNFKRWKIDADAISIIAFATVAGVAGAKLYHVLEKPEVLMAHPSLLISRAGFAWFGGLIAGVAALLWQGGTYKIRPLRMLDLCAPSAALGYGIGRWGCQLSGDGDYGIPTKMWFGMSYPHGIDPTFQKVYPTPIFEFIGATIIFYILWRRSRPGTPRRLGQITGEYLIWTGAARFLVEFIRRNPKIFLDLTNAQWASVGSIVGGIVLLWWARRYGSVVEIGQDGRKPEPEDASKVEAAAAAGHG